MKLFCGTNRINSLVINGKKSPGNCIVVKDVPYDNVVNYVQSDGQSYVLLDEVMKKDKSYEIYIDYEFTSASPSDSSFCGVRDNVGGMAGLFIYGATYGAFGENVAINWDRDRHIYQVNAWYNGKRLRLFDGKPAIRAESQSEFKFPFPTNNFKTYDGKYPIFGRKWNSNNVTFIGKARLYRFYIKDYDGNMLQDIIPVVRSNKGYLYDVVKNRLYANDGKGKLLFG